MILNRLYFYFFFLFFFFLRCYNFREVLAFSTSFLHLIRFLMQSLQFVIFHPCYIVLFTSSSHLFLGLSSDLVSAGAHSYTFFTMLLSGIQCTCPNQANLSALMQFMMFLLPVSLFSSSFDLIHHVPSFSLVPSSQIPLVWFLCFLLVPTFHRHMLPLVCLTNVLYIHSLEFLANSLLLNRS